MECCEWRGIRCDAKTGEVVEVDLRFSRLHGRFHSNSSLFRLLSIGFLDLSNNDLHGPIPSSLEKLSHLTELRLSYNQFSGQIPSSIGNLSHLTSLDLSDNQFSGQIPSSIGKISHLRSLHLSENNFDGEIPSSFDSLKQLEKLDLGDNKLNGNFLITLLNLTKLSYLSLGDNQFTGTLPLNISSLSNLDSFLASDNGFVGTLPSSLFTIPSLTFIDLSNNQLEDVTFEFGNTSELQILNLGGNKFRGPIPSSISKLINLKSLDLSGWNTQGPFDISILSHLKSLKDLHLSNLNTTSMIDLITISSFSKSLEVLSLSGNHVLATNKSSVSDPPSQYISYLNLSSCSITEFPEFLKTHQQLWTLDISNNKIKGQVPGWLWTLPKLQYVNLSNNTFIGFERWTKLGPSSVLWYLSGSKNNFTGNIPSFVCELPSLDILDLSENNFSGSISRCLETFKGNHLSDLNLHQNHFSGRLPERVFKHLRSLDVGHNQLVGKLPRSLIHFSTLEVLNVESNNINDTFPFWLSSLQNLKVLVLRSNAFHGPVHQASFSTLKIIDISHNHFNGIIPSDYFMNWSDMSSLGTNEDRSDVNYMGNIYYKDSLVLMIKGVEIEMVRILTIDAALDFSGNRFEGEIPRSMGLLKELRLLNLSGNAFTGPIPSSMGNMTALESLDVSRNKLSGEIPQELGNLSYLESMNFSHNQLVGVVPGGTQFRRQPCSSFKPNSGLFGPALEEDCKEIRTPSTQQYETPEADEEEEEEVFSWIAAAIGSVPGILFGLAIGHIMASMKPQWFLNPIGRKKLRTRGITTR